MLLTKNTAFYKEEQFLSVSSSVCIVDHSACIIVYIAVHCFVAMLIETWIKSIEILAIEPVGCQL